MVKCINRALQYDQKTRNKILTDHFICVLFFLFLGGFYSEACEPFAYCMSSAVSLDGLGCYYGVGWAT